MWSGGPLPPKDASTIYLCSPAKYPEIIETPHMTSKVNGILKWGADQMTGFAERHNLTYKFIAYPGVGEKINDTDSYTGCIGLMQSGQVDAMLLPINYPLDIVNITQGAVLYEDRIGYFGAFQMPKFMTYDFVNTFSSFNTETWLIILTLLMLFRLLIWASFKLLRKFYPKEEKKIRRKDYTFRVLSHFSGKGEIESNTWTMKVTWMLLTLFSFWSFAIFYGLINTGLVVAKPPLIFENYDDLMKYGVKPSILKGFYADGIFSTAKAGTPEQKLWKWANEMFGQENLTFTIDQLVTVKTAHDFLIDGANYKRVVFTSSHAVEAARSSFCELVAQYKSRCEMMKQSLGKMFNGLERIEGCHYQAYSRYPESLKPLMMQAIYSDKTSFAEIGYSYIVKGKEHGLLQFARKKSVSANVPSMFIKNMVPPDLWPGPTHHFLKETCMKTLVADEDRSADELSSVSLVSIKTCFGIFAICILISWAGLTYEKLVARGHSELDEEQNRRRRDRIIRHRLGPKRVRTA